MKKDPNRNNCKEVIAPGIWIDQSDCLHISAHDLCKEVGIEPTLDNIKRVMDEVDIVLKKNYPEIEIKHRLTPDD